MKKFVLLAAMLAVTAAPAMADDLDIDDLDDGFFIVADGDDFDLGDVGEVGLESENEAESGGVDLSFAVSNEGDFAQQSTPALQFANTGNLNNAPSFVQLGSTADDFESGGIEFSVGPTLESESSHTVRQSSAAGR